MDAFSERLRVITSTRLTLVAADHALVSADLRGREELANVLHARVPENWPPELYDQPAMQYALGVLKDPRVQGWSFWYLVLNDTNELIGLCGFKGLPDVNGSVEIGYSVLKQYQNSGLATEAVTRLVSWAFGHPGVTEVSAETLPYLRGSIRVMEKNGFVLTGPGSEQGVVRYAVARPDGA